MRIALDGTPAAVQSAGVGRYTRELLKALLQLDADDAYQVYCAAGPASVRQLEAQLPPGAWRDVRRIPVTDRIAAAAWQRLKLPLPIDIFLQYFDVLHGPDFVLPPTKRPTVVTIHDLSFLIAPELGEPALVRYLSTAVPRTLRRASQIITVSASVAAELVEAYPFARDRVRAIPNGVLLPVSTRDIRQDDSHPTILIVGTIEPRKNHLLLLDAMQVVWAAIPDARLVIAGRIGWQSQHVVDRIRRAAQSSNVEFVESPSDDALERLFEEASLFVYPSLYEGFGLPVLEAMARKLPVAASNIASLRETGGNAARYSSPHDRDELGAAMVHILEDSEMRSKMVVAGLDRVLQYSWTEAAQRTRMAYQAAVEGHYQ